LSFVSLSPVQSTSHSAKKRQKLLILLDKQALSEWRSLSPEAVQFPSLTGGGADDRVGEGAPELPPIKPLAEFHDDPRYGGDLHRVDLAWARHAATMGFSASEIRAAIMDARPRQAGSIKRQREYAERTAGKAIRQVE
jgi:hypothetical protein